MKTLLGIGSVLVLMIGGCVQDPVGELSDTENIQNLLGSSGYVEMTPLDGQGDDSRGKDGIYPEHWWRELVNEQAGLELIFENDPATGICTVTVYHELYADFYIDVTHDGILNPGVKTIEDIRTRRLIVEKTGNESVHGGWVLTHITAAEFSLNSGIPQEVYIQSMKLYAGDELLWECDSPDTFYSVEDGLPLLEEGTLVRLEAEVLHTNPQYDPAFHVFVHGPCPIWPRHFMNDDGLYGDLTAGDGVFTYEWYVEPSSSRWFLAADVIDADTMMDQEEEDYDSGAWGILALRG